MEKRVAQVTDGWVRPTQKPLGERWIGVGGANLRLVCQDSLVFSALHQGP